MKLAEILNNLQTPIPSNLISKKDTFSKGKKTGAVDYVAWVDIADLLDTRCGLGAWQWEVIQLNQIGDRLTLVGRLTVFGDDRSLSQDATGTEELDCSSYGDPSSNAEAMALRRACAKFGLGRDLWRKEQKPASNPKPSNVTPIQTKVKAKPKQQSASEIFGW